MLQKFRKIGFNGFLIISRVHMKDSISINIFKSSTREFEDKISADQKLVSEKKYDRKNNLRANAE